MWLHIQVFLWDVVQTVTSVLTEDVGSDQILISAADTIYQEKAWGIIYQLCVELGLGITINNVCSY